MEMGFSFFTSREGKMQEGIMQRKKSAKKGVRESVCVLRINIILQSWNYLDGVRVKEALEAGMGLQPIWTGPGSLAQTAAQSQGGWGSGGPSQPGGPAGGLGAPMESLKGPLKHPGKKTTY